jgi:hypothetical protein
MILDYIPAAPLSNLDPRDRWAPLGARLFRNKTAAIRAHYFTLVGAPRAAAAQAPRATLPPDPKDKRDLPWQDAGKRVAAQLGADELEMLMAGSVAQAIALQCDWGDGGTATGYLLPTPDLERAAEIICRDRCLLPSIRNAKTCDRYWSTLRDVEKALRSAWSRVTSAAVALYLDPNLNDADLCRMNHA